MSIYHLEKIKDTSTFAIKCKWSGEVLGEMTRTPCGTDLLSVWVYQEDFVESPNGQLFTAAYEGAPLFEWIKEKIYILHFEELSDWNELYRNQVQYA